MEDLAQKSAPHRRQRRRRPRAPAQRPGAQPPVAQKVTGSQPERDDPRPQRLLIIGLDGATFDIINPAIARGELPVLTELIATGASGILESPLPITPAAWTSIATGKNPGKHGLVDFITRAEDSYRPQPVNRTHRRCRALWNLLSRAGKSTVLFNYPVTYPPETINGLVVSGMLTPSLESSFTSPPELRQELLRLEGGYRIGLCEPFEANEERFLHDLDTVTQTHRNAALHLMRNTDWDVFIAVFMALDTVAHMFWRDHDPDHPRHDPAHAEMFGTAIIDFYHKLDRIVGQLRDTAGPDTAVMIVSDHGLGPLDQYIDLNRWLADRDYLRPRGMRRRNRPLSKTSANGANGANGDAGPAVDWSKSRAYSLGILSPISINRKGREPEGTVTPGTDADALLGEIIAALSTLRGPDGHVLFDHVLRREEVCQGPYADSAPDLFVILDGMRTIGRGFARDRAEVGPLVSIPPESGTHRVEGIVIASGPGLRANIHIENATVTDIAPTALALLGLDPPDDMDGRVLDIIHPTPRRRGGSDHPLRGSAGADDERCGSLDPAEEAAIKARLRLLGYL